MSTESNNSSLVEITPNAELRITINSVAEAKQAIKELRLKKKEYTLSKKEITTKQQEIRADYANQTRKRGSTFRGGGTFGKILRASETYSRNSARSKLANDLAPLDKQKAKIDAIIIALEKGIMQLEAYILKNS